VKVLITGGLGYLGGRIADHLLELGFDIRLGSTRTNPDIPDSLSECEIVEFDLLDSKSLDFACQGVEVILHLAGMNAQNCATDPEQALLINGLGTLKLLKAAEKNNVQKFLYFSTAHVYGSPLEGQITEKTLPQPIHPYSITHRLAEDYVMEANKNKLIQGAVYRLSNAVGSSLDMKVDCWSLVVNDLCRQVITQRNMKILSNKYIERDFVTISSVCGAVSYFISSIDDSLNGEIFNISNGVAISLSDLSELLATRAELVLGYLPKIRFQNKSDLHPIVPLKISSQKIDNAGFTFISDFNQEIDDLLLNCRDWFGK
jgi:UDP-glucose 4-epimerase